MPQIKGNPYFIRPQFIKIQRVTELGGNLQEKISVNQCIYQLFLPGKLVKSKNTLILVLLWLSNHQILLKNAK